MPFLIHHVHGASVTFRKGFHRKQYNNLVIAAQNALKDRGILSEHSCCDVSAPNPKENTTMHP